MTEFRLHASYFCLARCPNPHISQFIEEWLMSVCAPCEVRSSHCKGSACSRFSEDEFALTSGQYLMFLDSSSCLANTALSRSFVPSLRHLHCPWQVRNQTLLMSWCHFLEIEKIGEGLNTCLHAACRKSVNFWLVTLRVGHAMWICLVRLNEACAK